MAHEADDMDTPTIAIVGLIAAGATFAAIYLIMWLYYYVAQRQETANVETPYAAADRTMAEQQAVLNEVGWIDQNTGQLRIPVSTAMGLVVDQLNQTPEDAGVDPEQFRGVDATNVGGAMNAPAAAADDGGAGESDGGDAASGDAGEEASPEGDGG